MTDFFTADLLLDNNTAHDHRQDLFSLDTTTHDRTILDNLADTLTDGDRLFILGNIAAGVDRSRNKAWLRQLHDLATSHNWTLYITPGDQDACHPVQGAKSRANYTTYTKLAHWVDLAGQLNIAESSVMFTHLPYTGGPVDPGLEQYRLRDLGRPVLHGHTCSTEQVSHAKGTGTLQINVGLDAWDLHPVPKSRIDEIIRADRNGESL